MGIAKPQAITGTELTRIAWRSSQKPDQVFHSLMHHFDVTGLWHCYNQLDGRKAVGTDGIDKERYGEDLTGNLEDLVARMKRMAYRPSPVRQVLIDKEGQPGAKRPLGISNFEDKLVQKRIQSFWTAHTVSDRERVVMMRSRRWIAISITMKLKLSSMSI